MLSTSPRTAENRLMKAIRAPSSRQILDQDAIALDVKALDGHHFILLVTTHADGREIATPMWFAADGAPRLVVRSGATDPKLGRIRCAPSVKVAACDFRGRPLGPPMKARARILPHQEEERAERTLDRALGWPRRLYRLVRDPLLPMAYIEITPCDSDVV
jgi:PPOX class probable F420-dependent enzyme